MAELEIPNRLLPALRYFIWVALPFIFFWVAVEKVFEGQSYRALASLGAAVLSFVAAVYWYRIIPARFRDEAKELQYLRTDQSFIWVPLPFTFSFIAVGRFFDGGQRQVSGTRIPSHGRADLCSWRVLGQDHPRSVAEQSEPVF
jgi:hypothetical protein